eukprot:2501084-Rhodomonas_salina.1
MQWRMERTWTCNSGIELEHATRTRNWGMELADGTRTRMAGGVSPGESGAAPAAKSLNLPPNRASHPQTAMSGQRLSEREGVAGGGAPGFS